MASQTIAFLILLPFALAFIYAAIHEYMRYKSEGSATYGLVIDEDTGTTHVTGIAEGEEPFDPEEFDPTEFNEGASDAPSEDDAKDESAGKDTGNDDTGDDTKKGKA